MRARCYNENHEKYPRYGGRGIRVCARWNDDFWAFVADVGDPPTSGHSIERVDNDGNDEPGNVTWATHSEQNRNKRNANVATWNGETLSVAAWAERFGVTYHEMWGRVRHYKGDMAKVVASVEKLKKAG
jgi:hypothetical protein